MKISDIKNKELRELAQLRYKECYREDCKDDALFYFPWKETKEGYVFWSNVNGGIITELSEEESCSWYNDTVEDRKESYTNGTTPNYYTGKYKGIKAIDVIHDFELSHCKASALEYILRSGKKDDEIQDLTKAINHLQMQIEFLKCCS